MALSGANQIIDPVLATLKLIVEETGDAYAPHATNVAYQLIQSLQAAGWDTEDDTLRLFHQVPWIVDAFGQRSVGVGCAGTCGSCGKVCGKDRFEVAPG